METSGFAGSLWRGSQQALGVKSERAIIRAAGNKKAARLTWGGFPDNSTALDGLYVAGLWAFLALGHFKLTLAFGQVLKA